MLSPWKNNYGKHRQCIKKNSDITLPTKIYTVKAMVFPVIMYGCESCTIKKVECQRTDAFKLWFWRRLLRVPWTAGRSNLLQPELGAWTWISITKGIRTQKTYVLCGEDIQSIQGVVNDLENYV